MLARHRARHTPPEGAMRRDLEIRSGGWAHHSHVMRVVSMVLALLFIGCAESPQAPRQLPQQPSRPPASPTPEAPSPPPPAPTQWPTLLKLHVAVVTTGAELDPDGYTVVVRNDPGEIVTPLYLIDTVGTNGSTVLDVPTEPGLYGAGLDGIAKNCTLVGPYPDGINVSWDPSLNPAELTMTFHVLCLAIPATQGVRVTTVVTGAVLANTTFLFDIASDSGAVQPFVQSGFSSGANESVTIPSPPGSFVVGLWSSELGQHCIIAAPAWQRVRVEPNQMASVTFNVACVP